MSVTDLASLALVGVECYALGAISAIDWPTQSWAAARIALRILAGAATLAAAQLVLALLGPGFASVPLVLLVAAAMALVLRIAARRRHQILPANPRRRPQDMEQDASAIAPTASRESGLAPGESTSASRSASREADLSARETASASSESAHAAQRVSRDSTEAHHASRQNAAAAQDASAIAPTASREPSTPVAERAAWLLLAVLLLAAAIRSVVVPESGWDAYSHWGLRAQAYALAGTVTNAGSEHEYYPPLIPLLEAWLALHTGAPNIDLAKTISALLGCCFAVCLAWHLRLALTPSYLAPLAAAAIVASPATLLEGFWTGQADLALTAWLTLATLAIWQYHRTNHAGWLTHAALFAAAAGLTKLEGTPRILIVAAAVYLITREIKPAVALAVPALTATLFWTVVASRAGISANSEHLGAPQFAAIGPMLLALVQVFGGVRTGGAVVVAILAWLVAYPRIPPLLKTVVAGQLALTLLAFLLGDTDPAIEVRTSATRLFAQFLPLALAAAAIGLRKEASNL